MKRPPGRASLGQPGAATLGRRWCQGAGRGGGLLIPSPLVRPLPPEQHALASCSICAVKWWSASDANPWRGSLERWAKPANFWAPRDSKSMFRTTVKAIIIPGTVVEGDGAAGEAREGRRWLREGLRGRGPWETWTLGHHEAGGGNRGKASRLVLSRPRHRSTRKGQRDGGSVPPTGGPSAGMRDQRGRITCHEGQKEREGGRGPPHLWRGRRWGVPESKTWTRFSPSKILTPIYHPRRGQWRTRWSLRRRPPPPTAPAAAHPPPASRTNRRTTTAPTRSDTSSSPAFPFMSMTLCTRATSALGPSCCTASSSR